MRRRRRDGTTRQTATPRCGAPMGCRCRQSRRRLYRRLWGLLALVLRHPVVLRSELRRTNGLRGGGKGRRFPILEDDGLPLLGSARVHHGAVAVAVDMLLQALVGGGPRDLADLGALETPLAPTLERLHQPLRVFMADEVHECVAEVDAVPEAHGHIDKVISLVETCVIEQVQEHDPRVPVRDVAQHACGAVLWHLGLLVRRMRHGHLHRHQGRRLRCFRGGLATCLTLVRLLGLVALLRESGRCFLGAEGL
mmetsp:Transcript_23685/g.68065  ORF Transcript_23685/g.68065 Transcript_23685/m.68065 type:complete len:252 (-) Transcript_23685:572-1327(-)